MGWDPSVSVPNLGLKSLCHGCGCDTPAEDSESEVKEIHVRYKYTNIDGSHSREFLYLHRKLLEVTKEVERQSTKRKTLKKTDLNSIYSSYKKD